MCLFVHTTHSQNLPFHNRLAYNRVHRRSGQPSFPCPPPGALPKAGPVMDSESAACCAQHVENVRSAWCSVRCRVARWRWGLRRARAAAVRWSKPPIRDTSCCYHTLTGVPCLRPGPRRCRQVVKAPARRAKHTRTYCTHTAHHTHTHTAHTHAHTAHTPRIPPPPPLRLLPSPVHPALSHSLLLPCPAAAAAAH